METNSEGQSPSEYLMVRFDSIKEFEEKVSKLGGHPVGLVRIWYGRRDARIHYPEFKRTLLACQDLAAVIGEDDPYWSEGRNQFRPGGV